MKGSGDIDQPIIAFNRAYVDVVGSVNAALMLSQAVYWTKVMKKMPGRKDGFFFKTMREWKKETGLTADQQVTARKCLRNQKFWKERKKGIPCKLWFRVDEKQLGEVLKIKVGKSSKQGLDKERAISKNTKQRLPSPAKGGGNDNE